MEQIEYRAFTTENDNIVSQLRNRIHIGNKKEAVEAIALWDTGANGSCISEDVVKGLNLQPTGYKEILTPSGKKVVNTYLVDVFLPNHVMIEDLSVCDSDIGKQNIGMLLGMDIITLGDFAVSNYNGKTLFTFRAPSKAPVDFAKQISMENKIGPKHGKGKKKRK